MGWLRMDIAGTIRRHPGRTAVAAVVALALFVFGMLWFTPWRLFTDEAVNEAAPGGSAPVAETSDEGVTMGEQTAASEDRPIELATGEFFGLEHESHGRAVVIATGDQQRFLRFEDFETSNGPDLLVYLSTKGADPNEWRGYDEDFIDLGPLKGNVGNQNYEIPAEVDLEKYSTAVVWCRRFEVGFAAANLA
ncbi:MAG: DM13 domain-containing protein [Actinomycetota bacterium]|nr:DM13 domain-containing protein [Actinomycetota bacterium]